MPAIITYPADGRGAWPSTGKGGTLKSDGTAPGRFYRTAAGTAQPLGRAAYRADRDGTEISIDEYAVWRAAIGVQNELRDLGWLATTSDGLWGAITDEAVRRFQQANKLTADGVFGPASARALFGPVVHRTCNTTDPAHATDLTRVVTGTINLESGWDPGAVGSDTNDLGLGQVNGPAHPTMSVNDRLNPRLAIPFVVRLVDSNLRHFNYDIDLGVAAYNLGKTGATRWRDAGKPDVWVVNGVPRDVRAYINKILNP